MTFAFEPRVRLRMIPILTPLEAATFFSSLSLAQMYYNHSIYYILLNKADRII